MPSLFPAEMSDTTTDLQLQLRRAVERDDARAVAALIRRGADPNAPLSRARSSSLLLLALDLRKSASALALIDNGADPNQPNTSGDSSEAPLWEILDSMNTAEHRAAMEALISRGADVNAINSDGDPLLHGAIDYGDWPLFQALLDSGADLEATDRRGGRSALIRAIDENRADFAQALIERGARLDATDQAGAGRSVLQAALERSDPSEGGSVDSPFHSMILAAMERSELSACLPEAPADSDPKRV